MYYCLPIEPHVSLFNYTCDTPYVTVEGDIQLAFDFSLTMKFHF
jgi:hypothetical protein